MSVTCSCGRPIPDAYLCRACSLRLERALGDLPALIADLDVTLTRQSVTGAHSPNSGKQPKLDAQPAPLHWGAAEVAYDLHLALTAAVQHLATSRALPLPVELPTPMVLWLLRHHSYIRLDKGGPVIAEHIHKVTAAILTVIDLPRTRGRFKVGNCPEQDQAGVLCPGEVWVHLPAEDLGEPARMECRVCGTVYETWQWNRAGMRMLRRGSAA